MLPKSQRETVEEWLKLAQQFQTTLNGRQERTMVMKQWEELKQQFHSRILPLTENPRLLAWVRETHRLLRILDTQLLFWTSARGEESQRRHMAIFQQLLQQLLTLTPPL